MRTLTEFNRGRVGMMGAVVTVLVVGVAQSFTSVPMLFVHTYLLCAIRRHGWHQHGR